jgi:hypothetical protein
MRQPLNAAASHTVIAVVLFAACLAFPGYYNGATREPQLAWALLVMGWLGPLAGNFSWLANPAFLAAVSWRRSKPNASLVSAVLALLLALAFLLYRRVLHDEGGSTTPITAYGYGYLLWVLSFAVFSFGQLRQVLSSAGRNRGAHIVTVCGLIAGAAFSTVFLVHFYVGSASQYGIQREREAFFEIHCREAVETIHEPAQQVHGIYMSPDAGFRFGEIKNGHYSSSGSGVLAVGFVNSNMIDFYETSDDSRKRQHPFRRFRAGDHAGESVESLESNYSVITKSLTSDLRPELAIYGATISIVDNRRNVPIAQTTYFVGRADRRICAQVSGSSFETMEFIRRTLNLSNKGQRVK